MKHEEWGGVGKFIDTFEVVKAKKKEELNWWIKGLKASEREEIYVVGSVDIFPYIFW